MVWRKFTVADVLDDITALVKEYGSDHVDENRAHRYLVNGAPTCLLGHVMVRRGIRVPKMLNNTVFAAVAEQMKLRRKFTQEALGLMAYVQRKQDAQWSWGAILREADRIWR